MKSDLGGNAINIKTVVQQFNLHITTRIFHMLEGARNKYACLGNVIFI